MLGKKQILEEKGLFILPSELFCNIRKNAKNNENLNVTIANIFDNIESSARGTASENDVKGLFDDFDVKGNKLGNTVEEKNENTKKSSKQENNDSQLELELPENNSEKK